MDKPQYITMKDPEELKMHCITCSRKYIYNFDREISLSFIDNDLFVRRIKDRASNLLGLIDKLKNMGKHHIDAIVFYVDHDYDFLYDCINVNEEYKYIDKSLIASCMHEAYRYIKSDEPMYRLVDIANDIIYIRLNYPGYFNSKVIVDNSAFLPKGYNNNYLEDIIWVKKIDIRRYNGNNVYFDYVNVEFYIISAIKRRKEFIIANKKHLLKLAKYAMYNNKRFASYNIPYNYLKLDRIQITKDNAVIFTYSLKELKENDNNAQE